MTGWRPPEWEGPITRDPQGFAESYGVRLDETEQGLWVGLGRVDRRQFIDAVRARVRELTGEDLVHGDDDELEAAVGQVEYRRAVFTQDGGEWHGHWGPEAQHHPDAIEVTLWFA